MVAEILREKLDDRYERYLQHIFGMELEPTPIHKALSKIKTPLILTTNYDYLLEDTYGDRGRMRVRTQDEARLVQGDIQGWTEATPPVVFKIHGSISQPKTIVLTERDYRDLIYNKSGYRTILSAILVTNTVLMLGFSFDDPELKELLGFMREAFEYKSKNHLGFVKEQVPSLPVADTPSAFKRTQTQPTNPFERVSWYQRGVSTLRAETAEQLPLTLFFQGNQPQVREVIFLRTLRAFGNLVAGCARPGIKCQGCQTAPGEPG